jgi:hypothetical protein
MYGIRKTKTNIKERFFWSIIAPSPNLQKNATVHNGRAM